MASCCSAVNHLAHKLFSVELAGILDQHTIGAIVREGLYPLSGGGCGAETGLKLVVEMLY